MVHTPSTEVATTSKPRHWYASLQLQLGLRAGKTRLLGAAHQGPLRVQRAFYPEGALPCVLAAPAWRAGDRR